MPTFTEVAIFCTTVLFSLIGVVFSMVKLFTLKDNESPIVYIGLMTTILGVWLPQPSLRNNVEHNPV